MTTERLRVVALSFAGVAALLGCHETHGNLDASADVAFLDVPFDVPGLDVATSWLDVGRASDPPLPASCADDSAEDHACAYDVLAAIDADMCADLRECGVEVSDAVCAAEFSTLGGFITATHEHDVRLVRLGRLEVDLEAARCWLTANLACFAETIACPPLFVPVGERREGDVCFGASDCGAALRCRIPDRSAVGRCEARLHEGEACPEPGCNADTCTFGLLREPTGCARGHVCHDFVCRRVVGQTRSGEAERCEPVVTDTTVAYRPCARDLYCRQPIHPGGPQECVHLPGPDEICLDGAICALGTRCIVHGREPFPFDRACEVIDFSQLECPECQLSFELMCGPSTTCERSERRLGDLCDRDQPCREGACIPIDDTAVTGRCTPVDRRHGQTCHWGSLDDCVDGLCVAGLCRSLEELANASRDAATW
jgi:hypothetical protein